MNKVIKLEDYINPLELVKELIDKGDRDSLKEARTIVYLLNKELFNNWDSTLLGDKESLLNGTKVYSKEFITNSKNNYNTIFDCVNLDCIEVARTMVESGLNPAILNLASRHEPCGGYQKGACAQEEALSYASTLSCSLYQYGNPTHRHIKSSGFFKECKYPLDINFGGIYTPSARFFRDRACNYYKISDKPFNSSIITVASLNNHTYRFFDNEERKYFKNGTKYSKDERGFMTSEGIEIEKNKIRTILRIALTNNHDSLVLGALGCGVYDCKIEEVSKLFALVFEEEEFKNKFKKVTFCNTRIN